MMSADEISTHFFLRSSARSWSSIARSPGSATVARRAHCRRQSPHQVRSAGDADEPAVTHERHALDPLGLEQYGEIGKLGRVADRGDIARHDVLDRVAVRLDIAAGELPIGRDRVDPPRAPLPRPNLRPALGPGFDAVQQVTLADDAHYPIVGVDDRNPADPTLGKECCQRLHRCIRVDGDDLGRHHIHRAHRSLSLANQYNPKITIVMPR
jgi:hypothetical protein